MPQIFSFINTSVCHRIKCSFTGSELFAVLMWKMLGKWGHLHAHHAVSEGEDDDDSGKWIIFIQCFSGLSNLLRRFTYKSAFTHTHTQHTHTLEATMQDATCSSWPMTFHTHRWEEPPRAKCGSVSWPRSGARDRHTDPPIARKLLYLPKHRSDECASSLSCYLVGSMQDEVIPAAKHYLLEYDT